MEDWKAAITAMVRVKQKIAENDKEMIWKHHFPEIGATDEMIVATEEELKFELDSRYKSFLKSANGWKGFFQNIDLFGTNELCGNEKMVYALTMLESIEDIVFESIQRSSNDLLPIACNQNDRDLFLIEKRRDNCDSAVFWIAGEEIDNFSNFDEFFLGMIEYNRYESNALSKIN